jgi:hypothetical protein
MCEEDKKRDGERIRGKSTKGKREKKIHSVKGKKM